VTWVAELHGCKGALEVLVRLHVRVALLLHRISFQERRRFSTAVNSRTRLSLPQRLVICNTLPRRVFGCGTGSRFNWNFTKEKKKKNVESLAGILALETHKFPSVQVFVKLVRFSFNSSPRPQPPPRPVISSTPSQIPPEVL
jgi:hypothetical protein